MRHVTGWVVRQVRLYRPDGNPLRRRSDRLEGAGLLVAAFLVLLSVWPAVTGARQAYTEALAEAAERRQVAATLLEDTPPPQPSFGELAGYVTDGATGDTTSGVTGSATNGVAGDRTSGVAADGVTGGAANGVTGGVAGGVADGAAGGVTGRGLGSGADGVRWAEARWTAPGGLTRTGRVPVGFPAEAGTRLTVWVDGAGALAGPPASAMRLRVDAVVTALLLVSVAGLLVTGMFTLFRRALDRARHRDWATAWALANAHRHRRRP
ncbi:hypothetical protein AB0C28_55245 [Nonomuraea sp. NPDC048892]|uniref:hypothetical protein n=1 Tax=Nonomuraea sp. NPDC048892 TaxID=3154624 RepID=UPI00340D2A61